MTNEQKKKVVMEYDLLEQMAIAEMIRHAREAIRYRRHILILNEAKRKVLTDRK